MISPFVDVIDAREPLRDLAPRNGRSVEEAEGDGGSGAILANGTSPVLLYTCYVAAVRLSLLELSPNRRGCRFRVRHSDKDALMRSKSL